MIMSRGAARLASSCTISAMRDMGTTSGTRRVAVPPLRSSCASACRAWLSSMSCSTLPLAHTRRGLGRLALTASGCAISSVKMESALTPGWTRGAAGSLSSLVGEEGGGELGRPAVGEPDRIGTGEAVRASGAASSEAAEALTSSPAASASAFFARTKTRWSWICSSLAVTSSACAACFETSLSR